jgi:hypothetical protein
LVELFQHVSRQPDEPVAIRGARVLEADVAWKRRGDGVKRGLADSDANHAGEYGSGRAGRQRCSDPLESQGFSAGPTFTEWSTDKLPPSIPKSRAKPLNPTPSRVVEPGPWTHIAVPVGHVIR